MTVGKGTVSSRETHHQQIVDAMRRRDIPAALEELRMDLQLEQDEV